MAYYVYVLKSVSHNRYYKGMTQNVHVRIKQHNSGKMKSAKAYAPWVLLHVEEFPDRRSAREQEKFLKTGVGRDFIRSLS